MPVMLAIKGVKAAKKALSKDEEDKDLKLRELVIKRADSFSKKRAQNGTEEEEGATTGEKSTTTEEAGN